ncbi:MAG: glycosyltransferase family 9 protein [Chloroflexi bacterium]|nr:glycosyltransferase family 9 protein [Chloroflexota bacterium]
MAITGSAGEKALTQEIVAKSGREVVNLAGQLGVGELAAVLATANLAVGVDNGPMHLAAAAGTPTVRLYGPTDVSLFGPRGDAGRHIVIKAGLPCVPCCDLSPRVDPGRGGECMAAIRVDDVIAAIYRLLGEGVCK